MANKETIKSDRFHDYHCYVALIIIMTRNIDAQVKNATKWSAITEITAKLVTPVTSMVLARLLTPEAYGIMLR